MPSAKTARPTSDTSRSGSSKRARLSSPGNFAKKALDDIGLSDTTATASTCKVPKFLRSLYAILQTEDPHIISWLQNEDLTPNCVTAFQILEMYRFEREILPKYFKHRKFASFQRQLNNFGFRKWTKTQSSGVCTFSHNCFPPDLSTNNSNMSVRDQWRQKSTQVIPSSSAASVAKQMMKRQIAGTNNDNVNVKQEQVEMESNTPCRRPVNVQAPCCDTSDASSHTDYYRSPNSATCMENSAVRLSLSHQPPLKKLARANTSTKQEALESLNSLEAFSDDPLKQFTLPSLQSLHYETESSRKTTQFTSPSLINFDFRFSYPQALNNLTADSSLSSNELKPYDLKHTETQLHPLLQAHGTLDTTALHGAFLEAWMWDTQTLASNLEIGSLDFDGKNELSCKLEADWQECPKVDNGRDSSTAVSVTNKDRCQQNCGESSTSEEFGLENFLFVE